MSDSKESTKIEVNKLMPFLIGVTIAVLVVIAGIVVLVYVAVNGGNFNKNDGSSPQNGINVVNNINVHVGKNGLNGMWPVPCTDLFA